MRRFYFLSTFFVGFVVLPALAEQGCPDGFLPKLGPGGREGYVVNADGVCVEACGGGMDRLHLSNGESINLISGLSALHALNIRGANQACHIDVLPGAGAGLNFKSSNGLQWHLYDAQACQSQYTLSYSCGDGATGTAPESRQINYGDLYSPGYEYGTCRRDGYYVAGWTIDGENRDYGRWYEWNYETDKTLAVRWTPRLFGVAYVCNNGWQSNTAYSQVTFEDTFSPNSPNTDSGPSCDVPWGKHFDGYRVYDVFGNDTGDTVAPNGSFKYMYPYNIQLHAIWAD